MWYGLDPDIQRQLATIKEMHTRRFLTPTREWPLVVVADHDALLVIREWPDGGLTAYACSGVSGARRSQD
jgi:hypothetical protein